MTKVVAKCYCDRCNKLIKKKPVIMSIGDKQLELCEACANTVYKFAIKERGTATHVDMPKVIALRKAGWKLQAIADEMNVDYQIIQRRLSEYAKGTNAIC